MASWLKKETSGDWLKVRAIAEEYGWSMVLEAAQKEAERREAENMRTDFRRHKRMSKIKSEYRIVEMADRMGVRLNG